MVNERMIIDFELMKESLPILLQGLWVSFKIAALSCAIGFPTGTVLALLQTSGLPCATQFVFLLVSVIRGTPMLIQILCAFYILPQLGITINAFWTAVFAIALNSSIYISQIMRAGIQSINKGQLEAAQVLGLSKFQTLRYIILPQTLSLVLPALGSELVTLIKDSSLASVIGVSEITKEGRLIISKTYDAITIFALIALLYLVVTSAISLIVYALEKRMRRHVGH